MNKMVAALIGLGAAGLLFVSMALSFDSPPEPTITLNSGEVFTASEYRVRVDGYIADNGGYQAVCVSHIAHLARLEAHLDEWFKTEAEKQNARNAIAVYREACDDAVPTSP